MVSNYRALITFQIERLSLGFLIEVCFYFSHKIVFFILNFSIFEKLCYLKLNLLLLATYYIANICIYKPSVYDESKLLNLI